MSAVVGTLVCLPSANVAILVAVVGASAWLVLCRLAPLLAAAWRALTAPLASSRRRQLAEMADFCAKNGLTGADIEVKERMVHLLRLLLWRRSDGGGDRVEAAAELQELVAGSEAAQFVFETWLGADVVNMMPHVSAEQLVGVVDGMPLLRRIVLGAALRMAATALRQYDGSGYASWMWLAMLGAQDNRRCRRRYHSQCRGNARRERVCAKRGRLFKGRRKTRYNARALGPAQQQQHDAPSGDDHGDGDGDGSVGRDGADSGAPMDLGGGGGADGDGGGPPGGGGGGPPGGGGDGPPGGGIPETCVSGPSRDHCPPLTALSQARTVRAERRVALAVAPPSRPP